MKIFIPNQLQAYTDGKREVQSHGSSLAEIFSDLDKQFPGIRFRSIDEQDRIRPHIKIFIAGELAPSLDSEVSDGQEVQIVGALSGG